MNAITVKTRFAPSPSGLLHLGNARTALFSWLLARRQGGRFLLRIEDTDRDRSQVEHSHALMHDLRWLGLGWDEGPDAGGAAGPYLQSERGAIYARYFELLERDGRAYPCFCSESELNLARKAQVAAGRPPRYAGRCHGLSAAEAAARLAQGMKPTLRFHVARGAAVEFDDCVRGPQRFLTDDIGDFIIRRSDGTPAFFFSNAIDDALMGVTHVLRGEDHLTNTPRQILLLQALALTVPRYGHIPLIVGDDGAPLSKRHGARSLRELRDAGYLPEAVANYLADLGHHYDTHPYMEPAALAAGFELERLGRAPARYDETQLLHWQRQAVLHAPAARLWEWLGTELHARVPADARDEFMDAIVRANVAFPADALAWAHVVYADDWPMAAPARAALADADDEFFIAAVAALERHAADFKALTAELARATGRKGPALYRPLRAALTGRIDGPELARLLPLIGFQRARKRLEDALKLASR